LAPPPVLPPRPPPQILAQPQVVLPAQPPAARQMMHPPQPRAIRQPLQPAHLPIRPLFPQAVQQIQPQIPVERGGHVPRGGRDPGQVQDGGRRRRWEEFFQEIEDEGDN